MSDTLQTSFATALTDPRLPVPLDLRAPGGGDVARRFAVYRNNVANGLINALESRFPVVARLVGAEFFRAMARHYVETGLPRSPLLFRYGSTFPLFIEGFAPAGSVPYLADVARLELARGVAYHAADAASLPRASFAGLTADQLMQTGVRLHPSVVLLTSPHPIVSIWQAHQGDAEPAVAAWGAEAALVARPTIEVEVRRLPPGGYQFLSALSHGASIARAAAIAAAEAPDFDATANLGVLVEARIGVQFVIAHLA